MTEAKWVGQVWGLRDVCLPFSATFPPTPLVLPTSNMSVQRDDHYELIILLVNRLCTLFQADDVTQYCEDYVKREIISYCSVLLCVTHSSQP